MDAGVIHLLRFGDALLRLDPDPRGARSALAHLGGYALTHYGESTDALRELSHSIRGAEGDALEVLRALGAVRARSFVFEPRLPRWSEIHRVGDPRPLLPFDPELVGLQLGTRRLAKRDALDEASAEAVTVWWRGRKLKTRRVDHCVFGARREQDLDDAESWQRELETNEPEASRMLGEALGYPACCVDRYVSLGANDDVALACQLLPHDTRPASPLTLWLHAPLALVSHAPCSLSCEATRTLAKSLLDALDERHRGFAARWMHAAQRIHAFDANANAWSIGDDECVVLEGNAFVPQERGELKVDVEGVCMGERRFGLHADHRGEP